ncbi:hypothetical protein WAE56_20230 [Iodobacter sp. LRB]|uniref:hypothetical protein n=1 Tax=unclassified Iodobacter TaxID=235634 RepID=UPI000C0E790F|nr:hypothetical protein [Iodobacter sp. BJB302]PHV01532.1 hypothetical protein CSQ88_11845 [Iodobacter sp. BJB302]
MIERFLVKDSPILHNGERYEPGDKIEMSMKEAFSLRAFLEPDPSWVPEPAAPEPEAVITPPAIIETPPPATDSLPADAAPDAEPTAANKKGAKA